MHDRLKFQEECAGLVPRELKDREKMNRMDLSLQHLLRYADSGEDMLNRIFTGDESWAYYYQPLIATNFHCFSAMETSRFTFNQKV
jgi:hypothetical protein